MNRLELDVHVLTLPGLPDDVVARRRKSIAAAVAKAGFTVNVFEVEGVMGNLGGSRELGYSQGTAKYVTHVDHDDYVHEDCFKKLKPYLTDKAKSITTGEYVLKPDGQVVELADSKHHLAVYRREDVEGLSYSMFKYFPDQYLMKVLGKGEHINECLYYHIIYDDSASRTCRRLDSAAAKKELTLISSPELFVMENMDTRTTALLLDAEVMKDV